MTGENWKSCRHFWNMMTMVVFWGTLSVESEVWFAERRHHERFAMMYLEFVVGGVPISNQVASGEPSELPGGRRGRSAEPVEQARPYRKTESGDQAGNQFVYVRIEDPVDPFPLPK